MSAISIQNLRRHFNAKKGGFLRRTTQEVHALRGIDLEIEQGSLFGLLGPNGAGKTTTVKILTTLLLPSSGLVRIHGIDAAADPHKVRARIGYAFGGEKGFYDRLSARDNLLFFADLYQLPIRQQSRRVDELLELVDLTERKADRVETYSRGMKQRLHIARSLLHDPSVIFLDEPTNGLDPVAARNIRAAVSQLREAGKTILLTTHYMFEAEELCDRLAVIDHGRILVQGTARDLAAAAESGIVARVETRGATASLCEELIRLPSVVDASLELLSDRELLTVRTTLAAPEEAEAIVKKCLGSAGETTLLHLSLREPTLEDTYVTLVSHGNTGAPE
ncbi:ABC transporter ATP-binding protein [Streptomyces sp. NPDC052503]|uniref:ABC transporter ATP-binding protein n=1 Tax=Streptomyces sp. NPDC052503 TaxID=3156683 RepID=UPI001370ADF2|nr:ABC transporter ATP-binding protein [Streptomyces sp. SID7834]MYT56041.1 ATP-binding cassette domain-containing protein [Streptomyces sp. SID7834]MYT60733.1 ATP-binding cassette domain-containing protein [Streptomyces sp. SID7834]